VRKLASGLVVVGLFVGLVAPAASTAAQKFGANITGTPPAGSNFSCSHPCTMWNSVLSLSLTDPSVAAPISGVVVSYSIVTTNITSPPMTTLHLRVVRKLTLSDWAGFGMSTPDVLPVINAPQTFPARVPIAVGDYVALESTAPQPNFAVAYNPGQASGSTVADTANLPGILPSGAGGSPETFPTRALAVEATVEADSDNDGFGDETQDKCPGVAGTINGCPAPAAPTTKKKCKKKKRHSAVAAKKKCKKHKK
jgi:hypothetical protein